MLKEWGPWLSVELAAAGIFLSFFASLAWLSGHVMWLKLNEKKLPTWLSDWFEEGRLQQARLHNVYVGKGIAWIINGFAMLEALWPYQTNGQPYPYPPLVGNVRLINIGAITFELTLFFLLTGFFRWVISKEEN